MSSQKVYNFAAGPSKVPEEVMVQIQKELLNFDNQGISVMELSHRSASFEKVIKGAEEDLRTILSIPKNYKVLFLQGGGNGQFAAIPLNLCTQLNEPVDYIITGSWSDKAAKEAEKYCKVNRIANPNKNYTSLPELTGRLNPAARYVYYCANETIHGIEYSGLPEGLQLTDKQVLVCDMSSNFLTRKIDVSKYGVIYAGAQKNVGIAGVTVVIVRDDLLDQANPLVPTILHYKIMADNNSLYNTPPCFAVYVTRLCLEWILKNGGIEEMERRSIKKSQLVYNIIDASNGFYVSKIKPGARSRVNIPFRVREDAELEKVFLQEAQAKGMIQLKGHRSVGGIRVSMFNAVTVQEVEDFAAFLREFQAKHQ